MLTTKILKSPKILTNVKNIPVAIIILFSVSMAWQKFLGIIFDML